MTARQLPTAEGEKLIALGGYNSPRYEPAQLDEARLNTAHIANSRARAPASVAEQDARCCGCQLGCLHDGAWRGWMGIEPTQDASAAPRKRF